MCACFSLSRALPALYNSIYCPVSLQLYKTRLLSSSAACCFCPYTLLHHSTFSAHLLTWPPLHTTAATTCTFVHFCLPPCLHLHALCIITSIPILWEEKKNFLAFLCFPCTQRAPGLAHCHPIPPHTPFACLQQPLPAAHHYCLPSTLHAALNINSSRTLFCLSLRYGARARRSAVRRAVRACLAREKRRVFI